jgi:hypothetical protein
MLTERVALHEAQIEALQTELNETRELVQTVMDGDARTFEAMELRLHSLEQMTDRRFRMLDGIVVGLVELFGRVKANGG